MNRRFIQLAPGANPGDAITNEMRIIGDLVARESFFSTQAIHAEHIHTDVAGSVQPFSAYVPRANDCVLFHYGISGSIGERMRQWPHVTRALVYHNITPARYYQPHSLYVAGRLERARRELREMRGCFDLAFADSQYNAEELRGVGYENVHLLPVLFGLPDRGASESAESAEAEQIAAELPMRRDPRILFVGRLAPNKGHADLLKTFYFVQRAYPEARLVFAGSLAAHAESYRAELERLRRYLGIDADSVSFTGFLSEEELAREYERADVFLCASHHEGFCVPLLEAMDRGLPVIAYASPTSAVAETMAGAGLLIRQLDHARMAECVVAVWESAELRERLIAGQRRRLAEHDNQRIFRDALFRVLRDYIHARERRGRGAVSTR